jgi:serine phosphatase RsbU (regulator of sigma subunit)
VAVEKGAALLLVSRGVIECEGHHETRGEEFGLAAIKQFLQSASASTAQDLCASVLKAVGEFSGGAPLCDDRTALALIRNA